MSAEEHTGSTSVYSSDYAAVAWKISGSNSESEYDEGIPDNYGSVELIRPTHLASPSRKRYIPYYILLTFSSAKYNAERLLFIFLLMQGTAFDCELSTIYQAYVILTSLSLVVILPLLSYSIDRLSNYSHIILWVFLGLEIVIELISVLNPSHDVLVAVLIFVHNMANAFEMSALWKTFKQMVSFDETTTNLEQNKTLTLIGMLSIFSEAILDAYIYLTVMGLQLIEQDFDLVLHTLEVLILLLSISSFLVAYFMINSKFILNQKYQRTKMNPIYTNTFEETNIDNIKVPKQRDEWKIKKIMKSCKSSQFVNFSSLEFTPNSIQLYGFTGHIAGIPRFYYNAFVTLFSNSVFVIGYLHMFLIYSLYFVGFAGVINIINTTDWNWDLDDLVTYDDTATCAGVSVSLTFQFTIGSTLYVFAAIVMVVVLGKMTPIIYFQFFYPLYSFVLIIFAISMLFWDNSIWILSVMTMITISSWFLFRYDTFLVFSVVESQFVGVLCSLTGTIRGLTFFLPTLLIFFKDTSIELPLLILIILVLIIGTWCVCFVGIWKYKRFIVRLRRTIRFEF